MQRFIDANRAHLRSDDYAALYDWSIESPDEFWAAVWRFCEVKAATPYDSVLRDASRMPGAKWFEGAKLNFAANLLEHDATGTALVFAQRARRAQRDRVARAARASRERRRAPARARREARRSSRGVHREPPGNRRRDARDGERRRRVVVVLAGLRRRRRARPLRADRAESAVRDRRLFLQRQEHRFAADRAHGRRAPAEPRGRRRRAVPRPTTPTCSALPNAHAVRRAARAARRASLRARRIRRAALHSLFVRHDGRAEVHRARRRRHAAPASQGARAAHGHPRRRRRVLLHDLRLDDVELARLGARVARDARCSTTARRCIPIPAFSGVSPSASASAIFGTSAKYLSALEKSGFAAARAARVAGAALHPLDGLAARAGELRLRLPQRQGRRAARVDRRRHRSDLVLRARQSIAARSSRRAAMPRARHEGRDLHAGRPLRARAERRARLHGAVPVDADRLLERRRRPQVPRRVLRALPERVASRRLRRADGATTAS